MRNIPKEDGRPSIPKRHTNLLLSSWSLQADNEETLALRGLVGDNDRLSAGICRGSPSDQTNDPMAKGSGSPPGMSGLNRVKSDCIGQHKMGVRAVLQYTVNAQS